jgi:uncharacterized protein with HEPN domain
MRERIRDIDRLRNIEECITNINNYLHGKTYDEMKEDSMCFHAVVYNMMIIGEAANLLTKEFRNEHEQTPWRDIVDMRNLLIHGYITTNSAYIWDSYTNDLPILNEQIKKYVIELSSN